MVQLNSNFIFQVPSSVWFLVWLATRQTCENWQVDVKQQLVSQEVGAGTLGIPVGLLWLLIYCFISLAWGCIPPSFFRVFMLWSRLARSAKATSRVRNSKRNRTKATGSSYPCEFKFVLTGLYLSFIYVILGAVFIYNCLPC